MNLWIAYGLAISAAALGAAVAFASMCIAGASFSNNLSSIFRAARGAELEIEMDLQDQTARNPLPEYLAKATVTLPGLQTAKKPSATTEAGKTYQALEQDSRSHELRGSAVSVSTTTLVLALTITGFKRAYVDRGAHLQYNRFRPLEIHSAIQHMSVKLQFHILNRKRNGLLMSTAVAGRIGRQSTTTSTRTESLALDVSRRSIFTVVVSRGNTTDADITCATAALEKVGLTEHGFREQGGGMIGLVVVIGAMLAASACGTVKPEIIKQGPVQGAPKPRE